MVFASQGCSPPPVSLPLPTLEHPTSPFPCHPLSLAVELCTRLTFSGALVTNGFTTVLLRSPPLSLFHRPGPPFSHTKTYLHGNISRNGNRRRRRRGRLHPGGVQQKRRNLRLWKTLRAQDQRVAPRPRPRSIAITIAVTTGHRRPVLLPMMLVPVLFAVPYCRGGGEGVANAARKVRSESGHAGILDMTRRAKTTLPWDF